MKITYPTITEGVNEAIMRIKELRKKHEKKKLGYIMKTLDPTLKKMPVYDKLKNGDELVL